MATSDLISNASLVSTLTGDAVVSVAEGVGQNQKNIKMSDFASVAAGLIGFSGLSIRKRENSQAGAATSTLFNGCSRGVVLFSIAQANMDGHFDAIIYIGSSNSIRVVSYNNGSGSEYQKFSISNGALTITNTGYGVGSYIAYLFE